MNVYSDYQVNNDDNSPRTPYDVENINAYYNNKGNNDEVSPNPSTNDVNINANSDDEKMIMRLPLIQLKMVGIVKQLTMIKTNIMKKRLRSKQIMKT